MLKDFFTDFKTAINDLLDDLTLPLIYPKQWKITKKIVSNSKKH